MKPSCLNVVGKENLGQLTRAKKLERRCERELSLGGNPFWVTSMEVSLGKLVGESRASYSDAGVGHIFVHSAFCRYRLAVPLTEFNPSITAGTSPTLGLYLPRNTICGCHRGNFKTYFLCFFKRNLRGKNQNCPQMSYSGLIMFFSPGCNEI